MVTTGREDGVGDRDKARAREPLDPHLIDAVTAAGTRKQRECRSLSDERVFGQIGESGEREREKEKETEREREIKRESEKEENGHKNAPREHLAMMSGRSWNGVMRRKPSASHWVQYMPGQRAAGRLIIDSFPEAEAGLCRWPMFGSPQ